MSRAAAPPSLLVDYLEACRMLGVRPSTWRDRVQRGRARDQPGGALQSVFLTRPRVGPAK
jgi:hypothetical protein